MNPNWKHNNLKRRVWGVEVGSVFLFLSEDLAFTILRSTDLTHPSLCRKPEVQRSQSTPMYPRSYSQFKAEPRSHSHPHCHRAPALVCHQDCSKDEGTRQVFLMSPKKKTYMLVLLRHRTASFMLCTPSTSYFWMTYLDVRIYSPVLAKHLVSCLPKQNRRGLYCIRCTIPKNILMNANISVLYLQWRCVNSTHSHYLYHL